MSESQFQPIRLSLSQLAPTLAVEVLPYGLTVHRIYVQADGKTHDIIVGPEDPAEYAKHPNKYKNTIIGRYTNRVPVASHELTHPADPSIKSVVNILSNESPTVSLHGGPHGFDEKTFEVIKSPEDLRLFSASEKSVIKKGAVASYALFKYTSPDGDQGYPGELYTEVLIGLTEPAASQVTGPNEEVDLGAIFVVYRAKVSSKDGSKIVTPVNMTQHWGFNLDASLREGDTPKINDHLLQINSDHILELSDVFLASGKLNPVQGTQHEHKADSGPIGKRISPGYDDYYLFNDSVNPQGLAPGRVPLTSLDIKDFDLISPVVSSTTAKLPSVILTSPKSGIKASFDTNQSGVQFWSAAVLDGSGSIKRIHGGSGKEDGKLEGYKGNCAAFLEFHEPHAAFLHPELVSKSISKFDTLIGSDDLYHNFVKLDLRYQTPPESVANL